jgi:protein ImuB
LPDYCAERNFAEPVATEETIRATLRALAGSLAEILEKRGEGARRLEAAFFRADGIVRRIAVETGTPVREPKVVERLFREKLDALIDPLDPGFGFDLIRLEATRAERAREEEADFDSGAQARREIRFLIDRLAARFGADRVLAFQPGDTHIPEAAWAAVPAQYAQEASSSWQRVRGQGEAPRRPLRLFAKPEPVSLLRAVPGSAAFHMRWRGTQRVLKHAEGPERIAMEWWRHQDAVPARDYWRVEDDSGRRLWLLRDTATLQWTVHGVFL